jgi:hypothetical protein
VWRPRECIDGCLINEVSHIVVAAGPLTGTTLQRSYPGIASAQGERQHHHDQHDR